MADNTELSPGSGGDVYASDDIGGVKHQRVKMEYGDDGSATDVSPTNPMPVTDAVVGAADDAAVDSDANGTLSAKLRGLVKILADVWDAANNWFRVKLGEYTPATADPAADVAALPVRVVPIVPAVNNQADPAAGDGLHIISPTAGKWARVLLGHTRLTTDTNEANRYLIVSVQDSGGNPFGPTGPDFIQVKSTVCSYCYIPGVPPGDLTGAGDGGHRVVPLPAGGYVIPAGGAMIILVTGVQAGDTLSDMSFLIEERDA